MKIQYNTNPNFKFRHNVKKILSYAAKTLGQPKNLLVEINFVGEKQIKELNSQFRGVDKATDVLSFPMLDIKYGTRLDNSFLGEFEKDIALGSVCVCNEIAIKQAEEYGHSVKREMLFLILHSFLHLLGYDHMESQDEELMMLITKRVLDRFNITRGESKND